MLRSPSFSLLALALLIAALAGCSENKNSAATPPPPPTEVQVARPVQRDEPIYAEWVGSVDGLVNAQVRAQVSGYLLHQNYQEGSHVKAGDLLFEVDARPFQALVDVAKANSEKAEADFKRVSALVQQQVVAKQDYDNAVASREVMKASLAQAQLNLEFTQIRSPIDGIAGLATAQIGDLVGPNSGILTTVSTVDPVKVYFPISEQTYLQFRQKSGDEGLPFPENTDFNLILSDGTPYPEKGKFFAIDRQIDPGTGTIRVAATFPNHENLLRPGQYARVRAITGVAKNALEVPQRAVSELQGGFQLAIVGADNVVHIRTVKVGPRVGTRWIISDGLKPDEQVIVEGLQKVREGDKVSAKPFPGAALAGP